MNQIRILFTGVGRRVELIQTFRNAALSLNIDLKIYGSDASDTAPALVFCDYIRKTCSMRNPLYISELVEICKKDKIDIVIPTIDTDLLILSKNADLFKPCRVLISSADMISICRDKNKTGAFFRLCGCLSPETVNDWNQYKGDFPCFIKPKDGSSSINAYKVESLEELETYANQIDDYIIQPYIDGTEYTVDVFCDFNGNPIYITPRIRLQVRAGEVLKTQICLDDVIIQEVRQIIEKFKPIGPLTIQLIRQRDTNKDFYIEINPRYGGGAPLSMKAGARSTEVLLKLLNEDYIDDIPSVSNNVIFSRFDQSVCIRNEIDWKNIKGIIFDLDDTLYSERDYVKSGFRAVAGYIGEESIEQELWDLFESDLPAIDTYLERNNLQEKKLECLTVYREHFPKISLFEGVQELIGELKKIGIKVGIITDGRPIGQRNKIKALGLDYIIDDIIITDELGGPQFRKPNDIAFRIMKCRWKLNYESILYIGDNLNKDWQAPKQLGMNFLYFNNKGIYKNTEFIGIPSIISSNDFKTILNKIDKKR